jgi:hypothetical protein
MKNISNEPEMEEVDIEPNNIGFTIDRKYLKRSHFINITNKESG